MSVERRIILGTLIADPARTNAVSPQQAADLIVELAALQATLVARLGAAGDPTSSHGARPVDDRLLTPVEAAQRLSVTIRWLYRHADRLDFTRRLSRKQLRFSEAGLRTYLARKGPCR